MESLKKTPVQFTDNQKKILKYRKYISSVFYVLVILIFLTIGGFIPTNITDAVFGVVNHVGELLVIAIVSIFYVLVAGLLLHFIKMKFMYGSSQLKVDGTLILELKNKSALTAIVAFILAAFFAVFVNLILFKPSLFFDADIQFDFGEKLAFSFFYFLSHFLLIIFGFGLFNTEPYFAISSRGFLYNPAGVSFGMVLWKDVNSVKETAIMQGNTYNTIKPVNVIAVGLQNPDSYLKRYNFILRNIVKLGNRFNRYQTEVGADVIIPKNLFSLEQFDEIVKEMKSRVNN